MKTIIILLMIFGLYACDESTVSEPKDDTKVEIQKYTLEEILADTNWVEIDTVNIENSGFCITPNQYSDTILKISNLIDYNYSYNQNFNFDPYIKDSTSCYLNYQIPIFDFDKYDKLLSITYTTGSSTSFFKIYFNNKIKSYFYYRQINHTTQFVTKDNKRYEGSCVVLKQAKETKAYFQEKIIEYKE